MKAAFESALGFEVVVPDHYNMMGAIGAAIIARAEAEKAGKTNFKGFNLADSRFVTNSFDCDGCTNKCEVIRINEDEKAVGCFGDRCGKWSSKVAI